MWPHPKPVFLFTILLSVSLLCPGVAVSQFILNGEAKWLDPNCALLTPNTDNKAGSIWYQEKVDLRKDLDLQLEMFFGCRDAGADGMAFILQPLNTSLGVWGGGMGYMGIKPSLGVEFDVFQNKQFGDPLHDHMALSKNGVIDHGDKTDMLVNHVPAKTDYSNIEDCSYHKVRISWDSRELLFRVYFDCVLRLEYRGDIVKDIFNGDPYVYWGVTSAGGWEYNETRVCIYRNDYVSSQEDVLLCKEKSAVLHPRGGVSYHWRPDPTLSDTTIENPVVTPPQLPYTYYLWVTDKCGNTWPDSITLRSGVAGVFSADTVRACGPAEFSLSPEYEYRWMDGTEEPYFTASASGWVWVNVWNGSCKNRDSVYVEINGNIDVWHSADTSLCPGKSFLLKANIPGAEKYLWQDGSSAPDHFVDKAGIYWVAVLKKGCYSIDTIQVRYDGLEPDLGPDQALCAGEKAWLSPGMAYDAYIWQDGSTGPSFITAEEGAYWVKVMTDTCVAADTVKVVMNELPRLAVRQADSICLHDKYLLNAGAHFSRVEWWDGSTEVSRTVEGPGIYPLVLTDSNGCTGPDTFHIYPRTLMPLYIPGAFSPNGDGLNDTLFISGLQHMQALYIQVFNRWGERVFESASPQHLWNGRFNGRAAPEGLYSIILQVQDCNYEKHVYKSGLMLLR